MKTNYPDRLRLYVNKIIELTGSEYIPISLYSYFKPTEVINFSMKPMDLKRLFDYLNRRYVVVPYYDQKMNAVDLVIYSSVVRRII